MQFFLMINDSPLLRHLSPTVQQLSTSLLLKFNCIVLVMLTWNVKTF